MRRVVEDSERFPPSTKEVDMRRQALVLVGAAVVMGALAAVSVAGQATWTPPVTPWGDPDLQGAFTNKSVTVNDPSTWTRPWTFAMDLTKDDSQPVFEYACHEGNYAMKNILSGARADERAAEDAAKKGSSR
jgi:hypothetical protein